MHVLLLLRLLQCTEHINVPQSCLLVVADDIIEPTFGQQQVFLLPCVNSQCGRQRMCVSVDEGPTTKMYSGSHKSRCLHVK